MGLDAQIGVRGNFTEADIELIKIYLADRFLNAEHSYFELHNSGISFYTGHRWYGEGYERGNWPHIYSLIRAFMAIFPENEVIYYEDTWLDEQALQSNNLEAETEESLQVIWTHFLGNSGTAYADRWNAWNERHN